jgi:hypothetical protein
MDKVQKYNSFNINVQFLREEKLCRRAQVVVDGEPYMIKKTCHLI